MNRRLAGILFIGLGIGLVLMALVLWGAPLLSAQGRAWTPRSGAAAEDFELPGLDNEDDIQLSAYRGKAVVLNFWATWCDPCQEEMPLLDQAALTHPDNLVVIGVNDGESRQAVADFVSHYGIDFPIGLDLQSQVSRLYTIDAYPTTFFIDPQGVIRAIQLGRLSQTALDQALAKVGIQ